MSQSESTTPMNVLFIICHDISRSQFGCYGKPIHTPHVDRLAASSLVFDRHYCQFALCGPTRANIFTGCRPDTTQRYNNLPFFPAFRERMGAGFATLPEHFKKHGYRTQALNEVFHGPDSPVPDPKSWSIPQWFPSPPLPDIPSWAPDDRKAAENLQIWVNEESRDVMRRRAHILKSRGLDLVSNIKRWRGPAVETADVPDNAYTTGMVTDKAVQTLENLEQNGEPFFLTLGYPTGHGPWCAPKRYWDLYEPEALPMPRNPSLPAGIPEFAAGAHNEPSQYYTQDLYDKPWEPTDEQLLELLHGNYACYSFFDAQVGVLIEALDRLGLRENTVVLFTTDHGNSIGEHGHWHKTTNYEPDVSVPLLISVPGQTTAGQRTGALTEHVDLYPTLCDLCSLPKPTFLEGTSAAPLFANPGLAWKKAVFSQTLRPMDAATTQSPAAGEDRLMGYSMRTDRYRFTRWQRGDGQVVACELYDYETDPDETVNVADDLSYADVVGRLNEMMDEGWRGALPPDP